MGKLLFQESPRQGMGGSSNGSRTIQTKTSLNGFVVPVAEIWNKLPRKGIKTTYGACVQLIIDRLRGIFFLHSFNYNSLKRFISTSSIQRLFRML